MTSPTSSSESLLLSIADVERAGYGVFLTLLSILEIIVLTQTVWWIEETRNAIMTSLSSALFMILFATITAPAAVFYFFHTMEPEDGQGNDNDDDDDEDIAEEQPKPKEEEVAEGGNDDDDKTKESEEKTETEYVVHEDNGIPIVEEAEEKEGCNDDDDDDDKTRASEEETTQDSFSDDDVVSSMNDTTQDVDALSFQNVDNDTYDGKNILVLGEEERARIGMACLNELAFFAESTTGAAGPTCNISVKMRGDTVGKAAHVTKRGIIRAPVKVALPTTRIYIGRFIRRQQNNNHRLGHFHS